MTIRKRILRRLILFTVNGLLFTAIGGLGVYIFMSRNGPPVRAWHEVELKEEYTASKSARIADWSDYLALEDRLFHELDTKLYKALAPEERGLFNRYDRGSPSDPEGYPINWNRSFEFTVENPLGGVLLLHGLSDSPYSMLAIGRLFQELGFHAVGLRLPGHGTAPAGLARARREDWASAVRIGVRHVEDVIGAGKPFLLGGYSNGAALSVEYTLSVLSGERARRPDGLVLVSPAIGVTPAAVFARWQSALASVEGLEKLAWTSLLPEFDPYKYNSFAINAGAQIYDLTERIDRTVKRLKKNGKLSAFPPILGFVSLVDATIPPATLVDRLLLPIGSGRNELVMFDVNRNAKSERYFRPDIWKLRNRLLDETPLPFRFTLLTNENPESVRIHAVHKDVASVTTMTEELPYSWPAGVYSLSHVALPFPPDDPVYGMRPPEDGDAVYLGRVELQGERGILRIPAEHFNRIRCNPFFGYEEQRIRNFVTRIHEHFAKNPKPGSKREN